MGFLKKTFFATLILVLSNLSASAQYEPDPFGFLSSTPAPVTRDKIRTLVYASNGYILGVVGCSWGSVCSVNLNGPSYAHAIKDFRYRYDDNSYIFSRWIKIFDDSDFHYGYWEDGYHGNYPVYSITTFQNESIYNDAAAFSVYLRIHSANRSALQGAFRMSPDGMEAEFRPMFYGSDFDIWDYSKIEVRRRLLSTQSQDINNYTVLYSTIFDGIPWGSRFDEIISFDGFQLQDNLSEFFDSTSWYMPSWRNSWDTASKTLDSKTSDFKWSPEHDKAITYCIYLGYNSLRILKFHNDGLCAVYDYTSESETSQDNLPGQQGVPIEYINGTNLRVILPANDEIVRDASAPLTFDLKWGDPPSPPWDTWTLEAPDTFFRWRGHAFSQWLERFNRYRVGSGGVWRDPKGHELYILSRNWDSHRRDSPPWYVLEFDQKALIAIYGYDDVTTNNDVVWEETRYLPPLPTPTPLPTKTPRLRPTPISQAPVTDSLDFSFSSVTVPGHLVPLITAAIVLLLIIALVIRVKRRREEDRDFVDWKTRAQRKLDDR